MNKAIEKATSRLRLKQVLKNNRGHPLIVVGATSSDFEGAVSVAMPANIAPRDLNAVDWGAELAGMARNDKITLLIEDLDKLTPLAQQKFISLLKDRRAGTKKLPEGVQLVIPIQNLGKISKDIQRLALIWNLQ